MRRYRNLTLNLGLVFLLLASAPTVRAAEILLVGATQTRALLSVDGGRSRWVESGQVTPEGIKLIRIDGDSAVVEYQGARETVTLGQNTRLSGGGGNSSSGAQKAVLSADDGGHFYADGAINGVPVRFLVDTGASLVSMSASDAQRLGINYLAGQRSASSTANGIVPTYRVKLDQVKVGDIVLTNVDGMVHINNALPVILLGMSFLSRTQMERNGDSMVLTRRF